MKVKAQEYARKKLDYLARWLFSEPTNENNAPPQSQYTAEQLQIHFQASLGDLYNHLMFEQRCMPYVRLGIINNIHSFVQQAGVDVGFDR